MAENGQNEVAKYEEKKIERKKIGEIDRKGKQRNKKMPNTMQDKKKKYVHNIKS